MVVQFVRLTGDALLLVVAGTGLRVGPFSSLLSLKLGSLLDLLLLRPAVLEPVLRLMSAHNRHLWDPQRTTNIYPGHFNTHLLCKFALGAAVRLWVLGKLALQKVHLILCQPWLGLRLLRAMHASLTQHHGRALMLLLLV